MGSTVGAALVVTAAPAAASTITVTNTSDSGSNSLRYVLENLSEPSTVVLSAGATYELTDCTKNGGDILINDVVTIQGNGATIEQTCNDARVLETHSNITLENVTITGGNLQNSIGGGLVTIDASTTLTGVTFTGNSSGCAAGAVWATGQLTVTSSTFTDNHVSSGECDEEGGAIAFDPTFRLDAASAKTNVSSSASATITDSTFTNNSTADDGGAVAAPSGDSMLITGSTFNGNSSHDEGGAVSTEAEGFNLTIVNSTITNNSTCDTGAIFADGATLSLVYDTITDNTGMDCVRSAAADDPHAASPQAPDGIPTAVTVEFGTFKPFGTVIVGTAPYCDVTNNVTVASQGYNYSNEGTGETCGFEASTDNHVATNDAKLGSLADNGGPTATQLPQTRSPLIDGIPADECGGGDDAAGFSVTTDQRGVSRPQLHGCDIGSVEVKGSSLSVAKVVTGLGGQAVPFAGPYTFAVKCSDGTTGSLSVADPNGGASAAVANIEPGSTCTVVEGTVTIDGISLAPTYSPVAADTTGVVLDPDVPEGTANVVTVTNDYTQILAAHAVRQQPRFTG